MSTNKKISNHLIRKVAQSGSIKDNRLHVIPREGKWAVRREGANRAIVKYLNREAAIEFARNQILAGRTGFVLVHDLNGKVAEKIV